MVSFNDTEQYPELFAWIGFLLIAYCIYLCWARRLVGDKMAGFILLLLMITVILLATVNPGAPGMVELRVGK